MFTNELENGGERAAEHVGCKASSKCCGLIAVPGITQSNGIGKRWIIAGWCTDTTAARWSAIIEITAGCVRLHTCARELILLQELLDPPFLWIKLYLRCFRPLKLKEQSSVFPWVILFCFLGPGPSTKCTACPLYLLLCARLWARAWANRSGMLVQKVLLP